MDEGKPGAYFLKQLAGIDAPKTKGLGAINADFVDTIPDSLNEKQEKVVRDVLKRPSVYCIQGPPRNWQDSSVSYNCTYFCGRVEGSVSYIKYSPGSKQCTKQDSGKGGWP